MYSGLGWIIMYYGLGFSISGLWIRVETMGSQRELRCQLHLLATLPAASSCQRSMVRWLMKGTVDDINPALPIMRNIA